jgi:hypothetical protein
VIFRPVRKAADELILLDNTAEGKGHRVVAQFANGEIVKLAQSVPEWAQKPFGTEFTKSVSRKLARLQRPSVYLTWE